MCFVHVMWRASEEVLNLAKNKLTDIGCLNAMKDACLRSCSCAQTRLASYLSLFPSIFLAFSFSLSLSLNECVTELVSE